MIYYQARVNEVIAELSTDPEKGLSQSEAQSRLTRYGRNELPAPAVLPWWRRFLQQFKDILTILLLAATAVSFIAWLFEAEHGLPYETLAILAIVLFNALLGYFQESRAEHAVAALQAMTAPHARLIREGRQQLVPTPEIVPGDLLQIEEGDSLPADGRVIQSIALKVAEAALTGESTAVTKDIAPHVEEVGLADQGNMIFGGTVVVTGRGKAVITATGAATEIGKIADSLSAAKDEPTPLQKELDWVGKRLAIGVVSITVVLAAVLILVNNATSLSDLVQILLLAVSLAVAAVPEGLTAITTITLSLGVQRMARRNVIVRKLSAVETLGSTTVICTDKTGTLTKNEMTVRTVITSGGRADFSGIGYDPTGEARRDNKKISDEAFRHELQMMLGAATLVNNANLIEHDGKWTIEGDPTEGALVVAASKLGMSEEGVEAQYPRLAEIPFTSERKMMSTVHRDFGHEPIGLVVKGAPDILLSRCTHQQVGEQRQPLTEKRRTEVLSKIDALASEALRTIGVAYRSLPDGKESPWDEEIERDLSFLGMAGILDPARDEAQPAVEAAKQAGTRVIMITGDHPITARAIAVELGITASDSSFLTGQELQKADQSKLQSWVREVSVFARVAPEHKLAIVKALKANGEIVAMTGDGVNDAPALKAADIGIAMGITGTDVSKQAADMILTDDNFASIVTAVEEGRSIFKSIRAALQFLLSSNTGELLTMFLAVVFARVFGFYYEGDSAVMLPLLAAQILWINLLTDSAPALALAMEPADSRLMQRPPRDPNARVITGPMWFSIVAIGCVMAAGTLLVMDASLPGGLLPGSGDMRYARTMGFTTLVFFQLFNILNARAPAKSAFSELFRNHWIWGAICLSVALQVSVIYMPALQTAFKTQALSLSDWVVCVSAGSTVLWLSEIAKLAQRLLRKGDGQVSVK